MLEAAEEFVATFAENGTENTIWQRIAAAFRNFLRNLGFDLAFSDAELRSLLTRGLRNLQGSVVKDNLTTGEGARFLANGDKFSQIKNALPQEDAKIPLFGKETQASKQQSPPQAASHMESQGEFPRPFRQGKYTSS